jgi:hypothetical protein
MPRRKPYTCKTCGQSYVTARCPKCYPSKGKRRSRGSRSRGGRSSSRRAQIDWGRVLSPPAVNTDAAAGSVHTKPSRSEGVDSIEKNLAQKGVKSEVSEGEAGVET